jgi:hypothetical protein
MKYPDDGLDETERQNDAIKRDGLLAEKEQQQKEPGQIGNMNGEAIASGANNQVKDKSEDAQQQRINSIVQSSYTSIFYRDNGKIYTR